jgi:D-cysteine desulfhydrase
MQIQEFMMETTALRRALEAIPRHPLAFLPTPLVAAPRLSARLGGPRILLKRDDLTGLAFGGNKVRKLEFLIGAALEAGCDTVITGGAQQSNHSRQTAAAAAACGLACHLVLGGEAPEFPEGNLLIDLLCGAIPHYCGEHRKGEDLPAIAAELEAGGAKPYLVPYGGSNGVGALGFVVAAQELVEQLSAAGERAECLVFASSSGGTHAGIALGLDLLAPEARALGIGIDKEEGRPEDFRAHVASIADETARRLGIDHGLDPARVDYSDEFHGAGYGVIGEPEREAMRLMADTEGVLLDPVYTARAMAGLVAKIRAGEFTPDQTVVFWHTGGQPALFARSREILSS